VTTASANRSDETGVLESWKSEIPPSA